jgi:hypothetical protein
MLVAKIAVDFLGELPQGRFTVDAECSGRDDVSSWSRPRSSRTGYGRFR